MITKEKTVVEGFQMRVSSNLTDNKRTTMNNDDPNKKRELQRV
jgi:hypothetical protein